MSKLPDTIERDGLENDFKPLDIPPGLERFAGFFEAYNEQAKKLIGHKRALLDELKPWHDGRENAWHAIVGTAMSYRDGADLPIAHDDCHYDAAEKFRNYLSSAAEQMPLGELPQYQLNELIPLLDGFIAARPKPRHGLTKSPVPAAIIYQLAHLYQRSTGRKPGAGKGPFAIFVIAFWDALGKERKEDALKLDLQKARKARPEAFEVEREAGSV